MNFAEKVDTVGPEFLAAVKEHDEEKLNSFLQEFDTNVMFGVKVCNHCALDLLDQENEDDKQIANELKTIRQRLRIQKKLGIRVFYPESKDPLVLSTLKEKISNHINGMLSAISINNGWIFSLCEAFKNGDVDTSTSPMSDVMRNVMKVKHRNNYLRTVLFQYRDEVNDALSITDINNATVKLVDSYATDHPYDLEAMRFMKRVGNDFDSEA